MNLKCERDIFKIICTLQIFTSYFVYIYNYILCILYMYMYKCIELKFKFCVYLLYIWIWSLFYKHTFMSVTIVYEHACMCMHFPTYFSCGNIEIISFFFGNSFVGNRKATCARRAARGAPSFQSRHSRYPISFLFSRRPGFSLTFFRAMKVYCTIAREVRSKYDGARSGRGKEEWTETYAVDARAFNDSIIVKRGSIRNGNYVIMFDFAQPNNTDLHPASAQMYFRLPDFRINHAYD